MKPDRHRKHWSTEEDELLRELWLDRAAYPTMTIAGVAKRLDRSVPSVHSRATTLKLLGAPPGMESIKAAAIRTGYSIPTLVRILKAGKVRTFPALSIILEKKFCHRFAPYEEVDDAVAKWMDKESVRGVALRLNVDYNRLRLLLRKTGQVPNRNDPGGKYLLSANTIAKVIAQEEKDRRLVTLNEAASQLGVTRFVLARILDEAGLRPRHNRTRRYRTVEVNERIRQVVKAFLSRVKKPR